MTISPVTLGTRRLILRPWREADLEPFADLNADPDVMRYFPQPLSREESDRLANRIREKFASQGWGWWAVEVRVGSPFIGFVGLNIPEYADELPFTPAFEVGWRLAKAHWRRGYAREAALECLRFAFGDLGRDEVVSFTAIENLPSQAVMQSIGMTRDPTGDFDHPMLPPGHRLSRHVLYRKRRT
jgi:RimJ/RimL family protein N-acetyltransferase